MFISPIDAVDVAWPPANHAIAALPKLEPTLGEVGRQSQRIEDSIARMEALPDRHARDLMQDCLQAVLALHGSSLRRMLQLAEEAGSEGMKLRDAWLRDDIVRGLLLLHDLHPGELETRLRGALESVLPYIQSHGGNVELVGIENGVAKLRLLGSCKGCPSSAATMELTVKQAIGEACPDLLGIEIEGMVSPAAEVMR